LRGSKAGDKKDWRKSEGETLEGCLKSRGDGWGGVGDEKGMTGTFKKRKKKPEITLGGKKKKNKAITNERRS